MKKLITILLIFNLIWTCILVATLFFWKEQRLSQQDLDLLTEIENKTKYQSEKYFRINEKELEILNSAVDGSVKFTTSRKLLLKRSPSLQLELGLIEKTKSGIWIYKKGLPGSNTEGYFIGRLITEDDLEKVKSFEWEVNNIYFFTLK